MLDPRARMATCSLVVIDAPGARREDDEEREEEGERVISTEAYLAKVRA